MLGKQLVELNLKSCQVFLYEDVAMECFHVCWS